MDDAQYFTYQLINSWGGGSLLQSFYSFRKIDVRAQVFVSSSSHYLSIRLRTAHVRDLVCSFVYVRG
jgi:hypothetical protein